MERPVTVTAKFCADCGRQIAPGTKHTCAKMLERQARERQNGGIAVEREPIDMVFNRKQRRQAIARAKNRMRKET
jgi:hypothetical protein